MPSEPSQVATPGSAPSGWAPTKIIIDCDPGYDDALALLVALGSPALEVLAVTTVAGNQSLDKVTANALRVLQLAGRTDIPVAAGAGSPLLRDRVTAADIHGPTGLDGPPLPESAVPIDDRSAVDLLAELLQSNPRQTITLVPIGPLTNIATLVERHPHAAARVKQIVLMGGTTGPGNTNAVAEFNVFVDPEAADRVFAAGLPIRMVGLNVTRTATASPAVRHGLDSVDTAAARWSSALLEAVGQRMLANGLSAMPAVHDVCAVVAVIDPSLVQFEHGYVAVELTGAHTTGMTVVDRRPRTAPRFNAEVGAALDVDRLWEIVHASLVALP